MSWEAAVIGGGISLVGSLFGGSKAASAAKQQANAQNEAARRQHQYDLKLYEMGNERLDAQRQTTIEGIEVAIANEGRQAAFRDASNLQNYAYSMQIRNREQNSLNQQYLRSEDIYGKQVSLNNLTARAAEEDQYRRYQEIQAEASFSLEEERIKHLQNEGRIRVRGLGGRSTAKAQQATAADLGRLMSQLEEAAASSGRDTRSVLQEISRDKLSADLSAEAARMLPPGDLPTPIVPFKTPMATYQWPRELQPFDYGPEPVIGALASPSAAASLVWGQTFSSMAGTIGSVTTSYLNTR